MATVMKPKCDSRISISLSSKHHSQLSELSDRKEVSIAWLVRKAITQYLDNQDNQDNQNKQKHQHAK